VEKLSSVGGANPPRLIYGTYLGSMPRIGGVDEIVSIVADASGDAYVAGCGAHRHDNGADGDDCRCADHDHGGASRTVTWSSTNATACTASGGWSGGGA
jgi:hypothetical protein